MTKPEKWEEEFERKFVELGGIHHGQVVADPKELKSFIHKLLAKEREEMVKMLEENRPVERKFVLEKYEKNSLGYILKGYDLAIKLLNSHK